MEGGRLFTQAEDREHSLFTSETPGGYKRRGGGSVCVLNRLRGREKSPRVKYCL